MTKPVRLAVLAGLIAVGLYLAWPWLFQMWYAARLATMPAPGVVAMPVEGIKPRQLRDTWHAHRPPARRHEGIDIFAKRGTPVLSATEGIVVRRENNRLGGNSVWVFGPGGHYHYYTHLDRYAGAEPGERVMPGSLIGHVGNTGNAKSTPPHLHYGIYTGAGPINPYPLLTPDPPARGSR